MKGKNASDCGVLTLLARRAGSTLALILIVPYLSLTSLLITFLYSLKLVSLHRCVSRCSYGDVSTHLPGDCHLTVFTPLGVTLQRTSQTQ